MLSVILADDEPYILQGLERKVPWTDLGFEIIGKAGNGLDCLDLVRELCPDILVTDIRMPGITGLDLLERIQQLPVVPRVIYISGYSEFEYARRALELGAIAYLLKPIEKRVLVDALERARTGIVRQQEETKNRAERRTRRVLEFLQSLTPGTDSRIILDRLGLTGRYDGYLCMATEPQSGAEALLKQRDFPGDTVCLPMGEHSTIWILNVPASMADGLARSLIRKGSDGRATGISLSGRDPRELHELIRQARAAALAGFSSGEWGASRYDPAPAGALTEMVSDFESLLTSGAEPMIHRLLDQVREICMRERPSAEEILEFFNLFAALLGRGHQDGRPNLPPIPLIPDGEQLTLRFADANRMVDYLQEAVRDRLRLGERNAAGDDCSGDVMTAVRTYVRNHLDADLTLDHLAVQFGMDKSHLGTMFRAGTGKTLAEYVREKRIEHACFLLRNTRLTVQEIAAMCGYQDYFYFARLFRRERGVTASDFRKQETHSR